MMMDDETLLRDRKELTQLLAGQRIRLERVKESRVYGAWRQWLLSDIAACIAGLEEDIALIDEEMAQ
jgi:hypothetical protein